MKKLLLAFLISIPAAGYSQGNPNSVGLGVGPLYNGFGLAYEIPIASVHNYVSIGCPSFGYGGDSGFVSNCGAGYSIVVTPFSNNTRHGFGFNVGAGFTNRHQTTSPYYLAGFNYSYFYDGIENKGWNVQIGPALEYWEGLYSPTAMFGFGYQF